MCYFTCVAFVLASARAHLDFVIHAGLYTNIHAHKLSVAGSDAGCSSKSEQHWVQVEPWCHRTVWHRALEEPYRAGQPAASRVLLGLVQVLTTFSECWLLR